MGEASKPGPSRRAKKNRKRKEEVRQQPAFLSIAMLNATSAKERLHDLCKLAKLTGVLLVNEHSMEQDEARRFKEQARGKGVDVQLTGTIPDRAKAVGGVGNPHQAPHP